MGSKKIDKSALPFLSVGDGTLRAVTQRDIFDTTDACFLWEMAVGDRGGEGGVDVEAQQQQQQQQVSLQVTRQGKRFHSVSSVSHTTKQADHHRQKKICLFSVLTPPILLRVMRGA